MSLQKRKRIKSKPYLEWVATLPCAACEIRDGTVVAHHLKGRGLTFQEAWDKRLATG